MTKSSRLPEGRAKPDFSTDSAWEEWSRRDPYYSVLTNPEYRLSAITTESRQLFFESGQAAVSDIMREIRRHIAPDFVPRTILDFGCGIGRLLIPFASIAERVVGVDVSSTMLMQAQKNCSEYNLTNIQFALSDDELSSVSDTFELVCSNLVFQHIPTERGKLIFRRLLKRIAPGGVGAIQVLYSKSIFESTFGVAPPLPKARWYRRRKREVQPKALEMQMNPYNINELLFFLQSQGVSQLHIKFTDHGGELGIFLYFQVPAPSSSA
jgi:ubiquinone/menaquinone biosynthesis C-methylase UbiE